MAGGGIMHRVTPSHYNLYNEEETLVGSIHHVPVPNYTDKEGWYGHHVAGHVTALHPSRHHVAQELMQMPGDVHP